MAQPEQRPRSSTQLATGRFSCQGIVLPHPGQKERRGLRSEMPRGRRWITAFRKEPVIRPSRPTAIQETMAKGWLLKEGQEDQKRIGNDRRASRLLPGKALFDDLAEDVKQKLLSFLDPRRLDAGDNQFDISRTLGEAATLAEEGDGLHPVSAGFFQSR